MSLQIEYRSIAEMHPLETNPRIIKDKDFRDLVESIKQLPEFFEARPCILSNRTGKNIIIAGNQRYRAAIEAGKLEVPSILMEGLTPEQENEITIRDNVQAGKWDEAILRKDWDVSWLKERGVDIEFTDAFEEEMKQFNNKNCEYPVVPKYAEKYTAVIIVCKNEIDETFLRNILELEKSQSYKNQKTGTSFVLDVEKFRDIWQSKSK